MSLTFTVDYIAYLYRKQGYEVTVRPTPEQLPPFAKDYRIELLCRYRNQGALVAIRRNRDELAADGRIPEYAEVTAAQPDWRFDMAVLEGEHPNARELRGAREFSNEDIDRSLQQATELSRLGFPRYAVIAAWAALEAAMRVRMRADGRPAGWESMPRDMLTELYSAGAFAPDEFERMETASQLRSRIVHGFESPTADADAIDAATVQLLSDVTRRLVSEPQVESQAA